MTPKAVRVIIAAAWIGLILSSSTGMVATLAESLYSAVFQGLGLSSPAGMHLLAKKACHVLLFVVLGWLLSPVPTRARWTRTVLAVVCCFVVGAISEVLQCYFPGRNPRFSDVLIDGLSGTLASLCRYLG